jgi:predicted aspartyl protease
MKLITFLLFLLPVAGFSQGFTLNEGGPVEKNYYCEIPFEYVNGKMFLTGEIGGKKHRFLFDTGAPVAVSNELATEINAKTIHKIDIHDTYLHADSTNIVQLNGIKLGDITFNQIPAITLFPDIYRCYGIDGVIGSNLLRSSIISIDNNRHLIIITDQKSKLDLKAKNSTDLIFKPGLQSDPQIKIVLKNKLTLTTPFDTGDNTFFRLNDKTVADLKQYALFDTLAKGYGASGMSLMGMQNAAPKYLFKVSFITVGNGKFNNLITESSKDAIPAIGCKLIEYGVVTLDFIHGKFYFDAYQPEVDLNEKQFAVKPIFADNKLVAGVVWEKAKDLVKQGEQILTIDGKDYSNVTLCDLLNNKLPLAGKENAVLTIKNAQGEIRKVNISRE